MRALFLIMIITASVLHGQTEEIAAVMDIVNHGKLSDKNIARVRASIRSYVVQSKWFITLEPEIAASMLKEQGVKPDPNCANDDCLLKFGELVYAKKVIGGTLERTGNVIEINLKMLDVSEKKVVGSSSVKAKTTIDQLVRVFIPKLMIKLLKNSDMKSIAKAKVNKDWDSAQMPVETVPQATATVAEPPPQVPAAESLAQTPAAEPAPQTFAAQTPSQMPIAESLAQTPAAEPAPQTFAVQAPSQRPIAESLAQTHSAEVPTPATAETQKAAIPEIKSKSNPLQVVLSAVIAGGLGAAVYLVTSRKKSGAQEPTQQPSEGVSLDPPVHTRGQ